MRRSACGLALVLAGLLFVPATATAQDEAGIRGTVLDNTGGVLPGVTVVANGPAVLAPRTAFTDGAGLFAITALPAGTYTVTFTLQGFTTLVREGILLEGAFTANVDAEMAVGSVQETVTVTGQAPLVDVVSTRSQEVLPAERINALPSASSIMTGMQYVPGVRGNFFGSGPTLHGSDGPDSQSHIDGIETGTQLGSRGQFVGGIGLITDEAQVAEMVYDTSSQSA